MATRLYSLGSQLPADVRTVEFDWTAFLALLPGDSIASYPVTADSGITLGTPSIADDVVYVRVSGGTAGTSYRVTCTVTTTNGEVEGMVAVVTVADAA
jgi:hypothetical protein